MATATGTWFTVAFADFVASALEVATTVKVAGLGIGEGAVYNPLELIVPQFVLHPEMLHATALLDVPVTVAVNCWVVAAFNETVLGETETTTGTWLIAALADLVESA